MTKTAFDKIAAGLNEAIAIARGDAPAPISSTHPFTQETPLMNLDGIHLDTWTAGGRSKMPPAPRQTPTKRLPQAIPDTRPKPMAPKAPKPDAVVPKPEAS